MSQVQIHVPSTIVHSRDGETKNVFLVQEKLGQGGFAAVYRVTHQDSSKSYAVKVIPKDQSSSTKGKTILEKLKNEIQIQKKLNHPNIVKSKVSFSDEINNYIVLEFCPGKSVRDYLRKSELGHLSEPETRKILIDIVDGVSYLHNREIVHHDIKLENFLIGSDGKVKICDFGLATVHKEVDENDRKRPICGTTNYLSPEVILKKNKGFGFEEDIWAIGVAAFIMLTGRAPFEGGDKELTYDNIKNCNYQFPSKIQLSNEAKDFIRTILRVDPSRRPTAIDLIDHPFLSKFDNEQIQFYKSPQKVQPIQKVQSLQKFPIPQNNSYSPTRCPLPSTKLSMTNNNTTSPRIRSTSNLSPTKYTYNYSNNPIISDDYEISPRRSNLSNYVLYNHENNELNTSQNLTVSKNFVIPNYIVTKHCFRDEDLGYLLADGTVGVCFEDKSRIVIAPTEKFVQYYKNSNSYAEVFNVEETAVLNENLKAKISLVKLFAKSFKKFKYLYEIDDVCLSYEPSVPLQNVKYFVRKDDNFLFKLSNKNIQVNFSDFKKLIIFWNTKKMCIFRVIKEKCALLDLNDVANLNSSCDELDKFKKAKELLSVYDRKNLGL